MKKFLCDIVDFQEKIGEIGLKKLVKSISGNEVNGEIKKINAKYWLPTKEVYQFVVMVKKPDDYLVSEGVRISPKQLKKGIEELRGE